MVEKTDYYNDSSKLLFYIFHERGFRNKKHILIKLIYSCPLLRGLPLGNYTICTNNLLQSILTDGMDI